ncbi:MAG: hypothetical protein H6818_17470 [Phycisphaerales bacterium]|nr:hypothetical protein [Phycisphaerales bacterium]MCB9864581.1 hypothetical protein [Phycisphaerales bacterium]
MGSLWRFRALCGALAMVSICASAAANGSFPAEFAHLLPPQLDEIGEITLTGGGGPRGGGLLLVKCTGEGGAFTTIQSAIDAAVDGNLIAVFPNDCTEDGRWHENIDFLGKAIVLKSAGLLDPTVTGETIIDGDAAGPVVRFVNGESSFSVMDGFTITNGQSVDTQIGGGVRCVDSAPSIRRCVFRENVAYRGGGIGVRGGGTIMIDSCRFMGNVATGDGIDGSAAYFEYPGSPILFDCEFEQHGDVVVGINRFTQEFLDCSGIGGCGLVISCEFRNNNAATLFRGNGATLVGCTFAENSGVCAQGARIEIRDSRFEANTGGASIVSSTFSVIIERSDFIGNVDVRRVVGSSPLISTFDIRGCRFIDNQADYLLEFSGGGSIEDTEFLDNVTDQYAVRSISGEFAMDRCRFERNRVIESLNSIILALVSSDRLGLIRNSQFLNNSPGPISGSCVGITGPAYMDSCLFVGNIHDGFGTPFSTQDGVVTNCTIVGNRTVFGASGLDAAEVTNCVVYGNRSIHPTSPRPQVIADSLSYSVVEDATGGVGVSNADPRFVDFGHWDDMGTPADASDDVFVSGDYHLLAGSPCIDRGDPEFAAAPGATDLDGKARVQGCRVDIGAYEFEQVGSVVGDVNRDGFVDLDDVPAFFETTLHPQGVGICEADVNEDGLVDGRDIGAFVVLQLAG